MVAPIYDVQEKNVQSQIATAETDPYYESLLSGLESTKNRSFADIEGRAAGRGVAYGNIPSQQQAAYLGESYLPAVAEVKQTQLERINSLKQTLAELRAHRASSELEQTNTLRQEALSTTGATEASYEAPTMNDYAELVNQLRSSGEIGDSGYGAIAEYLRQHGYDISRNSLVDKALRKAYGFDYSVE